MPKKPRVELEAGGITILVTPASSPPSSTAEGVTESREEELELEQDAESDEILDGDAPPPPPPPRLSLYNSPPESTFELEGQERLQDDASSTDSTLLEEFEWLSSFDEESSEGATYGDDDDGYMAEDLDSNGYSYGFGYGYEELAELEKQLREAWTVLESIMGVPLLDKTDEERAILCRQFLRHHIQVLIEGMRQFVHNVLGKWR
ncbi:hypothetical protein F4811DRAFT_555876 [Daldinia bambusicola]|nr:hypothetical protein F4811DRAFT_555876 [Daldinia bambusicola]